MPVQHSTTTSCMLFYTPMAAPNFQGMETAAIADRLQRYMATVTNCMEVETSADMTDLARVATCIYRNYPDRYGHSSSGLSTLRGVAVFVAYMPPSF